MLHCKTISSFAGRSKIEARSSNGKLGRGNERAWIFDLPAKEETVLQSRDMQWPAPSQIGCTISIRACFKTQSRARSQDIYSFINFSCLVEIFDIDLEIECK